MGEWKEYKLGDVIAIKSGYAYKGNKIGFGKNILLGMGCVSFKEKFLLSGARAYAGDCADRYCANSGDIVLATRQQSDNLPILGMPAIVPKELSDKRIIIGANLYRVENTSDFNNEYIYWLLKTPMYLNHIRACQTGTTVRMITKANIEDFRFKAPNKEEREKIVSIIRSLDDKIEVNRRINENLEQQAQALFKSWFVDFEPFKECEFVESELGMIPKRWRVGTLGDILILKNDSYKKGDDDTLPYMPIDIIPMHSLGITELKENNEAQSSLQTFEKNDIVIGAMRVYFHRVVIAPCKGITRKTCFVLKPQKDILWAYSIMQCNQDEAINYANSTSKGSTMPYAVWNNGFENYRVVIPIDRVLKQFNSIVMPLLGKIRDSYKESRRLASLRDTLLPRLMSGEIRVDEINYL